MARDRQGLEATATGGLPSPVEPSPLDTDEIPVVDLRPAPRSRAARSLAFGAMAVALAGLAFASGLVLLFHYRPQLPAARADVVDLVEISIFTFARDLHRWASYLLIITAALHLLWVLLTAAHRPPRHHNHRLGLVLFALLLLLAASGYVLPWDVGAGYLLTALGALGVPIDDHLLLAVFALHVGLLPLVFGLLTMGHLRRARRDGARRDAAAGEEDG